MGKIRVQKVWSPVLHLGVLTLLATYTVCLAEKDSTVLLRAPRNSQTSPVFSSSIENIPVSSGTQQKNVYTKPNVVHSSATASAGGSGSDYGSSSGSQRNNNNNNAWYNGQTAGVSGINFEYGGSVQSSSNSGSSHGGGSSSSSSGGYYEQPPPAQQQTSPTDSYGSPTVTIGPAQGPSYTYHYQHFPNTNNGGQSFGGWSGDDGGFGGFDIPGIGGGGGGGGIIGGIKIAKIAKAIVKGLLLVKPVLLLLLLGLVALPLLVLFAPIPIISITGQPQNTPSGRSSQLTSYLSQLSGKVLNSEECLERIICKLPQPPEKYKTKAKFAWDEYGSKMVTNSRVSRGLNAYFDQSSEKNRNLKCNQRFKCSNKYL